MAYQYMSLNNSRVMKNFDQLQSSLCTLTGNRDADLANRTSQNAGWVAVDVGQHLITQFFYRAVAEVLPATQPPVSAEDK